MRLNINPDLYVPDFFNGIATTGLKLDKVEKIINTGEMVFSHNGTVMLSFTEAGLEARESISLKTTVFIGMFLKYYRNNEAAAPQEENLYEKDYMEKLIEDKVYRGKTDIRYNLIDLSEFQYEEITTIEDLLKTKIVKISWCEEEYPSADNGTTISYTTRLVTDEKDYIMLNGDFTKSFDTASLYTALKNSQCYVTNQHHDIDGLGVLVRHLLLDLTKDS